MGTRQPMLGMDPNQERTFEAEIAVASAFSPVGTPLDDIITKAVWHTLYRAPGEITEELRDYARNVIAEYSQYASPGSGLESVDRTLGHMIACYSLGHGLA